MTKQDMQHLQPREVIKNRAMLYRTTEKLSICANSVQISRERLAFIMYAEGRIATKLCVEIGMGTLSESMSLGPTGLL